jgi:hypothetical protein
MASADAVDLAPPKQLESPDRGSRLPNEADAARDVVRQSFQVVSRLETLAVAPTYN